MLTDAQRECLKRPTRKLQLLLVIALASQALFWTILFVAVVYFEVPVQVSGLPFLTPLMPYIAVGIACFALVKAALIPREFHRDMQKDLAEGKPIGSLCVDKNVIASDEFRDIALPAVEYEATRVAWFVVLTVGMTFNLIEYVVDWKMLNLAASIVMVLAMFVLLVILFPTRSRWERSIERHAGEKYFDVTGGRN